MTIASAVTEVLQTLPTAVLLLDEQLRVCWANDQARHVLRLPANSDEPESVLTFIEELSRHEEDLRGLFNKPAAEMSFEVALQQGATALRGTAKVKVLAAAGTTRLLSVLIDDLREGERSLVQVGLEPELMNQVLATLPHVSLVLDDGLHVLFASRGMAGQTVKQLHGLHISKLLPVEVYDRALAAMGRTLASGLAEHYKGSVLDELGRTRHYGVHVHAIRRDDKVIGLTLHAGETTEQVIAERAIATQAQMIDSMLEAVAVFDQQGVIHITNPAFDAMFGYQRGTLLGRDLRTLVQWHMDEPWHTQAVGESMTVEFEAQRRGGESFSAAGVLSGFDIAGRNHCLLVLQDVSERKQLERGVLQAVNREQYRIGNDLHDGLGQELTGIALMLRGLAGRLTTEYPPLSPEVDGITRLVNNAIESTRALARGLSPVNLERGGLQDALEGLAMHASELYGVQVVFTHRVPEQAALNPELANHLYRIAQEAVRNAVRHGKARSIRLHLGIARAKVKLSITDDGEGMPPNALDAAGMGLKIMCYRARIVGGDVSFESVRPTGTRVLCECPLEAGRAARIRKLPGRKARA
ncbi:MAG: PAS domain S-box protein [Povalibacter sp.]